MERSDYEDLHKAQSLRVPDASVAVERRKVGFLEYEKNGRMLGALLKRTSYMSAAGTKCVSDILISIGSGVAFFLALFGRRIGVSFAPSRLLWSSCTQRLANTRRHHANMCALCAHECLHCRCALTRGSYRRSRLVEQFSDWRSLLAQGILQ